MFNLLMRMCKFTNKIFEFSQGVECNKKFNHVTQNCKVAKSKISNLIFGKANANMDKHIPVSDLHDYTNMACSEQY